MRPTTVWRLIQAMNLAGGLEYMSITPEVMGGDVYGYAWAEEYKEMPAAAE